MNQNYELMLQHLTNLLIKARVVWNTKYIAQYLLSKGVRVCCLGCKHFLGGGDFGLCCDLTYQLKYEDSSACEHFEVKQNDDSKTN